ncbi:MAG: hypothetical protein Q4Q58_03365 [Thermoplasmata archaeon]|nr:hypothetical protein [Thermoplasmata archaeon]
MYVDNRMAAVALVALLTVVTASFALVFMGLSGSESDEREASHEYVLTGTVDGAECTGTGTSEYVNETGSGRVFQFTFTAVTDSGSRTLEFGIAFDLEDSPNASIYRSLGTADIDGETVGVWSYSEDGIEYTFYVGELCTVERVCIASSNYEITGVIV